MCKPVLPRCGKVRLPRRNTDQDSWELTTPPDSEKLLGGVCWPIFHRSLIHDFHVNYKSKFPLARETHHRSLCFFSKELMLHLNIPTLKAQTAQVIFTFEIKNFYNLIAWQRLKILHFKTNILLFLLNWIYNYCSLSNQLSLVTTISHYQNTDGEKTTLIVKI